MIWIKLQRVRFATKQFKRLSFSISVGTFSAADASDKTSRFRRRAGSRVVQLAGSNRCCLHCHLSSSFYSTADCLFCRKTCNSSDLHVDHGMLQLTAAWIAARPLLRAAVAAAAQTGAAQGAQEERRRQPVKKRRASLQHAPVDAGGGSGAPAATRRRTGQVLVRDGSSQDGSSEPEATSMSEDDGDSSSLGGDGASPDISQSPKRQHRSGPCSKRADGKRGVGEGARQPAGLQRQQTDAAGSVAADTPTGFVRCPVCRYICSMRFRLLAKCPALCSHQLLLQHIMPISFFSPPLPLPPQPLSSQVLHQLPRGSVPGKCRRPALRPSRRHFYLAAAAGTGQDCPQFCLGEESAPDAEEVFAAHRRQEEGGQGCRVQGIKRLREGLPLPSGRGEAQDALPGARTCCMCAHLHIQELLERYSNMRLAVQMANDKQVALAWEKREAVQFGPWASATLATALCAAFAYAGAHQLRAAGQEGRAAGAAKHGVEVATGSRQGDSRHIDTCRVRWHGSSGSGSSTKGRWGG